MKILFASLIFLCTPCWGALRITIDPGHGGDEKGAVHQGVVESQLALQISKRLFRRLSQDKKFQVQILRENDANVELEDRVKKSEKFATDLFISIHANANPNQNISGIEFYIQNQLPVEEEALFLAHMEHSESSSEKSRPMGDVDSIIYDLEKSHKILTSYQIGGYLRKKWSQKKRYPIRQGPFYVLSQTEIPAVLIEVGYLTNRQERTRLTHKDYQEDLAKKIHLALSDYAKNMDKLPSGILKTQNAKTR